MNKIKTNLCIVSAVGHFNNASKYIYEKKSNEKNIILIVSFKNGLVAERILTSDNIYKWDDIIIFEPFPRATSGLNPLAMKKSFYKFKKIISKLYKENIIDEVIFGVLPKLPTYNYMPGVIKECYPKCKLTVIEDGTATYMLGDNKMFEYMVVPSTSMVKTLVKEIIKLKKIRENTIFLILTLIYYIFQVKITNLLMITPRYIKAFDFDKLIIENKEKYISTSKFTFKEVEKFYFFNFKNLNLNEEFDYNKPIFFDQQFGLPLDIHINILDKVLWNLGFEQCYIKVHPKSKEKYINKLKSHQGKVKLDVIIDPVPGEIFLQRGYFKKAIGMNSSVMFNAPKDIKIIFIMNEYLKEIKCLDVFKSYFSLKFMQKSSANLNKLLLIQNKEKIMDLLWIKAVLGMGMFILYKVYVPINKIQNKFFSILKKIKEKKSKKIPLKERLKIQNKNYLKKYNFLIDSKIIFFESYKGKFACSPKEIYKKMICMREFENYTFVWAFSKSIDKESLDTLKRNKSTVLVKYGSDKYKESLSKASMIITNTRLHRSFYKKAHQIVIQTWHGTPFKKDALSVDLSTHHVSNDERIIINSHDVQNYNYFLTQNKFSTIELGKTFDLANFKEVKILEYGYPRNDSLFNVSEEKINFIKRKLYFKYNIPKNKKIIFYAPTWRDHHKTNKTMINEGFKFKEWKEKLSEEYHVIFRGHYFHSQNLNLDKFESFITDLSDYGDINDLYLISDILITDYSSVFFDYSNLKKPILFHMFDFYAYTNLSRKLHLDINTELPGPVSFQTIKLIENIKNIEKIKKEYKNRYDKFCNTFNSLDDGNCSKKVIEFLIKKEK